MAVAATAAEAEAATWVVVEAASTAVEAASAADTAAAPEVTAAAITEAVPTVAEAMAVIMAAGTLDAVTAAITEAVPMVAVVTAADLPDAATAAPLAPVAALQPGPGRGRVVAVDLPETSHLTQPPPTEIGTLLEAPAAHL